MDIQLSSEFVAALLGKSNVELEKLLSAADGKALEPSEMQSKITALHTEKIKKQVDTAVKNNAEKNEKDLAKKFGIDSYTDKEDLQNQISEKLKTGESGSDETAKKLEAMTAKNAELTQRIKAAITEKDNAIKDFEHRSLQNEVFSAAKNHISTVNFNLPADAALRQKAIENILKTSFSDVQFKKVNGKIVLTDKDGNALNDDKMNEVTIEKYTEQAVQNFGFSVVAGNGSGNGNPPNTQNNVNSGKFTFTKEQLEPEKFAEEYAKLDAAGNKEAAEALYNAYRETNYK